MKTGTIRSRNMVSAFAIHDTLHESARKKSGRPDLNRRPPGPQPDALPGCATSRRSAQYSRASAAADGRHEAGSPASSEAAFGVSGVGPGLPAHEFAHGRDVLLCPGRPPPRFSVMGISTPRLLGQREDGRRSGQPFGHHPHLHLHLCGRDDRALSAPPPGGFGCGATCRWPPGRPCRPGRRM